MDSKKVVAMVEERATPLAVLKAECLGYGAVVQKAAG
jgi:hypothetical protein